MTDDPILLKYVSTEAELRMLKSQSTEATKFLWNLEQFRINERGRNLPPPESIRANFRFFDYLDLVKNLELLNNLDIVNHLDWVDQLDLVGHLDLDGHLDLINNLEQVDHLVLVEYLDLVAIYI